MEDDLKTPKALQVLWKFTTGDPVTSGPILWNSDAQHDCLLSVNADLDKHSEFAVNPPMLAPP